MNEQPTLLDRYRVDYHKEAIPQQAKELAALKAVLLPEVHASLAEYLDMVNAPAKDPERDRHSVPRGWDIAQILLEGHEALKTRIVNLMN